MNMKKKFALFAVLSLLTGLCLAEAVTNKPAHARRRGPSTSGGVLVRPGSCQGAIRFVNVRGAMSLDALRQTAAGIRNFIPVDVEAIASETAFSPATATAQLAAHGATEAFFVVNDAALPMTLLAPEAGWAVVNVAPLTTDQPDAARLETRLQRLLWRTFALVNGAANTQFPHCVLKTVRNVRDLDALDVNVVCPEPFGRITDDLRVRGVTPRQLATYRQACREGWAPQPTNDIQRAIYDQVRSDIERGPTKPLSIPPPKK